MEKLRLMLCIIGVMSLVGCNLPDDFKAQNSTNIEESSEFNESVLDESAPDESTPDESMSDESSPEEENVYAMVANYIDVKKVYYDDYQKMNPDLSPEQVVTCVNIGIDRPFYSEIQASASLDSVLVLANKFYALPNDYEPSNMTTIPRKYCATDRELYLKTPARDAFIELCEAAKKEGYNIYGSSAYRSYSYQQSLYNNYVSSDGVKNADRYSARPGHSEHQTGLAIDVKNKDLPYDSFGETEEYKWAKNNSHKYGFVIRYTEGNEFITGYQNEEWHLRFVGKDVANVLYTENITLEEYLARE